MATLSVGREEMYTQPVSAERIRPIVSLFEASFTNPLRQAFLNYLCMFYILEEGIHYSKVYMDTYIPKQLCQWGIIVGLIHPNMFKNWCKRGLV